MLKRAFVLTSAVALVSFCVPASAADVFSLSSTTFKDGTMLPKKAANANTSGNNANCVGENVSPQFSWTGAPEGTLSFSGPPLGLTFLLSLGLAPAAFAQTSAPDAASAPAAAQTAN